MPKNSIRKIALIPTTQKAEASVSQTWDLYGLQNEFKAILGNLMSSVVSQK